MGKKEIKEGSFRWFKRQYYFERKTRLVKASIWSKRLIFLTIGLLLWEVGLLYLFPIILLPEIWIYLDSMIYSFRQKRKFKKSRY